MFAFAVSRRFPTLSADIRENKTLKSLPREAECRPTKLATPSIGPHRYRQSVNTFSDGPTFISDLITNTSRRRDGRPTDSQTLETRPF